MLEKKTQVYVPEINAALGLTRNTRNYRQLIEAGIKRWKEGEQAQMDESPLTDTLWPLSISPNLLGRVKELAKDKGLTVDKTFGRLLALGAKQYQQRQIAMGCPSNALQVQPESVGLIPKSNPQRMFFERLMHGLAFKSVVFCEGSTGIGKSRVIAAAALLKYREGIKPIVLSLPTVSLVEHMYAELRALDAADVKYGILPGAGEFVDDLELKQYMDAADMDPDLPVDEAVRSWVQEGAPTLDADRPLARQLGVNARWLMEDLRALAVTMPVEQFRLSSTKGADQSDQSKLEGIEQSQARELLTQVRLATSEKYDIILCTHAMLALNEKTLWSLLPRPKLLFIDEAHLFESTVSNMNSETLSLTSLRARLLLTKRAEKLSSPTRKIDESLSIVRALLGQLRELGVSADMGAQSLCLTELANEPGFTAQAGQIFDQCAKLHKALNSKVLKGVKKLENHRKALELIVKSEQAPFNNVRIDVTYSPILHYPSLSCGPTSVQRQLSHIWRCADQGVGLISATLYTPNSHGQLSADYLQNVLNVPFERAQQAIPVTDPYIYQAPQLWLPDWQLAKTLRPPKVNAPDYEQDLNQWHEALLEQLVPILSLDRESAAVPPAKGGVMVLLTSYRDIQKLNALMKERHEAIWQRCVFQSPDVPFRQTEAQYRAKYIQAAGHPILFALGGAWTGLDLVDRNAKDPKQDNLLTDLVIARLPIGLNQSNTMKTRTEYMGVTPIVHEALLTLKQGLGRLIRRNGVQNRRLWILDGRITYWPGMTQFTKSANYFLQPYTDVKTLNHREQGQAR